MVKNRIIAVMGWVIFLLWAYARTRMTREEFIEEESRELRNDPEYMASQEAFARELEEEPGLKEYVDLVKFEFALENVDTEGFK